MSRDLKEELTGSPDLELFWSVDRTRSFRLECWRFSRLAAVLPNGIYSSSGMSCGSKKHCMLHRSSPRVIRTALPIASNDNSAYV